MILREGWEALGVPDSETIFSITRKELEFYARYPAFIEDEFFRFIEYLREYLSLDKKDFTGIIEENKRLRTKISEKEKMNDILEDRITVLEEQLNLMKRRAARLENAKNAYKEVLDRNTGLMTRNIENVSWSEDSLQ